MRFCIGIDLKGKSPFVAIDRHRMGIDGKGVTTLIAFHGCPLRCNYCLNPQTWDTAKSHIIYYSPWGLYKKVKKDNLYFLSTGGGITFGGGEPCLHSRFISKFRRLCGSSWTLTVETSLNVPQEHLENLLSVVDCYIVDIKDMDAVRYRQYTGGENQRVIENLRFLLKHGKADKLLVRVPLIPRYNTEEDAENSIRLLKEMGVTHFDRFTYQTQVDGIGRMRPLRGKVMPSGINGWLEKLMSKLSDEIFFDDDLR